MGSRFSGVYELDGGTDVRVWAIEGSDGAVMWAEWGGWHWRAEGPDAGRARTRLETRLTLKDPFYGRDKDWGTPGFRTGMLDPSIEPETRRYMDRVTARPVDFPEEVRSDTQAARTRSAHPQVVAVIRCDSCGRLDVSRWFQVRSLGFGAEDWHCPSCGSTSSGLIEMGWEEYEEAEAHAGRFQVSPTPGRPGSAPSQAPDPAPTPRDSSMPPPPPSPPA